MDDHTTIPSTLTVRDFPRKPKRETNSSLLLKILVGGAALFLLLPFFKH